MSQGPIRKTWAPVVLVCRGTGCHKCAIKYVYNTQEISASLHWVSALQGGWRATAGRGQHCQVVVPILGGGWGRVQLHGGSRGSGLGGGMGPAEISFAGSYASPWAEKPGTWLLKFVPAKQPMETWVDPLWGPGTPMETAVAALPFPHFWSPEHLQLWD